MLVDVPSQPWQTLETGRDQLGSGNYSVSRVKLGANLCFTLAFIKVSRVRLSRQSGRSGAI